MDAVIPFVTFAVVAAITPGPNNLMLAASGVAFGWRRTLPHLLGIPVGLSVLILISGLGVGTLVTTVPAAALALKTLGSVYLLYLAWTLRGAFMQLSGARTRGRPIRFYEAALFQLANPKAWIMALSAVSIFVPLASSAWTGLAAVLAGFTLITLPCAGLWLTLGVGVERWLVGARLRTAFGIVMGVLMLYTVVSIWL